MSVSRVWRPFLGDPESKLITNAWALRGEMAISFGVRVMMEAFWGGV